MYLKLSNFAAALFALCLCHAALGQTAEITFLPEELEVTAKVVVADFEKDTDSSLTVKVETKAEVISVFAHVVHDDINQERANALRASSYWATLDKNETGEYTSKYLIGREAPKKGFYISVNTAEQQHQFFFLNAETKPTRIWVKSQTEVAASLKAALEVEKLEYERERARYAAEEAVRFNRLFANREGSSAQKIADEAVQHPMASSFRDLKRVLADSQARAGSGPGNAGIMKFGHRPSADEISRLARQLGSQYHFSPSEYGIQQVSDGSWIVITTGPGGGYRGTTPPTVPSGRRTFRP